MAAIISVQTGGKIYLQAILEGRKSFIRMFTTVDLAIAHIEKNSLIQALDFAIHDLGEVPEDDHLFDIGVLAQDYTISIIWQDEKAFDCFTCKGPNAVSWHDAGIKIHLNQGVEV